MFDHKQAIFGRPAPAPEAETAPKIPSWPDGIIALPEKDEDLKALIETTREDALCLVPVLPPVAGTRPTSFMGGRPLVSPGFAWPKGMGTRPNAFIAQIDCGALPDFAGREMLPKTGRLCFFLDWDISEKHLPASEHKGLVVHDTGDAIEEAALPMGLPSCHPYYPESLYPWLAATGKYPKTLTKWPLQLHVIRTYADESYVDPYGGSVLRYRTMRDDLMRAQFLALLGTPPQRRWVPLKGEKDALFLWTAGFPQFWIHVQIFLGLRIAAFEAGLKERFNPKAEWPSDHDALMGEYRLALDEARQLLTAAVEHEPYTRVSEEARAALESWCKDLHGAIGPERDARVRDMRSFYQSNQAINSAYQYGADLCVSQGGEIAAALGDDVIESVRNKRAPLSGDEFSGMAWHQMLGHGVNIQSAAQRHRGNKLLLAQFSSEGASAWQWGDMGALQYWIDRADLVAGRFDRVTLTAESH